MWTFLGVVGLVAAAFVASSEAMIRTKVVPAHNDYKYRQLFLSATSPNAIFGDSHAAYSLTGLEGFLNLAMPGNNFISIANRVRLYFRDRSPDKIILQAGPHHFSRDFMNWRPDETETFRRFLEGSSPYAFKMFETVHRQALFRYWSLWLRGDDFTPAQQFMPDGSRLEDSLYTRLSPTIRRANAERTLRILAPVPGFEKSEVARAYEETIQFLQQNGGRVCLVTFPVVSLLRVGMAGSAAYHRARAFFSSLAAARGIPYLDLSVWNVPDDLFADAHHLNVTGARTISARVGEACFGTPPAKPKLDAAGTDSSSRVLSSSSAEAVK